MRLIMRSETAITFALILCAAAAVPATTLVRMSLEQISQASAYIVRAGCVANSAAWDAGEIWTLSTFDVEETWRGTISGRITVRLLGGSTASVTSRVSGVPRFTPGEEVVLFLEPTERGDFSVVSWQQGTFRVRRNGDSGEASVTQDTASFETFDPTTRRFVANGIRGMALSEFRSRVGTASRNPGGSKP